MSFELHPVVASSVHMTLVELEWNDPTLVTVATTVSSPWEALEYVNAACPFGSVTADPLTPAFGPDVTENATFTFGSGYPDPSSTVASSVVAAPANAFDVFGPNETDAVFEPDEPIGRHWIDSLTGGTHEPTSIPPVSSTCVVSLSVVAAPFTVIVTVGATLSGVQFLSGKLLVSKLS